MHVFQWSGGNQIGRIIKNDILPLAIEGIETDAALSKSSEQQNQVNSTSGSAAKGEHLVYM